MLIRLCAVFVIYIIALCNIARSDHHNDGDQHRHHQHQHQHDQHQHPKINDALIYHATLDSDGKFIMLWTPHEDELIFEIQVATSGYAGLGFSSKGAMKGSDLIIGWVDDEGKTHLHDYHGVGNTVPVLDPSQDVTLLSGYKNGTHTVLRFARPWISCDKDHDYKLSESTVTVMWAYNDELPESSTEGLHYHKERGVRSIYLKEPIFKLEIPVEESVTYWDIRQPKMTLPSDVDNLYWCNIVKRPKLERKNHIIGYTPLINAQELSHTHHFILYECNMDKIEHHLEKWVGLAGAQCQTPNMPLVWKSCSNPIAVWAIGALGEMFPKNVGFPMGEDEGDAYYMMEIHYANPKFEKGKVVNSGIRIYHTEQLREHDGGIFWVSAALNPILIVPPKQIWTSYGHCGSECTQRTLPSDGIKIFSVLLHTHLIGSEIYLQQVRAGKRLPDISTDENYDFNYQQKHFLEEHRLVLPGDHLATRCIYDTTRLSVPTFGGQKTEEEMCSSVVSYYPRIDLEDCTSDVPFDHLLEYLGVQLEDSSNITRLLKFEFGEADLDPENARKTLDAMKEYDTAGELVNDFTFASLIYKHGIVSNPIGLRGMNFYDFLTDPMTWKDEKRIANLQRGLHKGNFHQYCKGYGKVPIKGLPPTSPFLSQLDLPTEEEPCQTMKSKPNNSPGMKTTFINPIILVIILSFIHMF